MKICDTCGNQIDGDEKICPHCIKLRYEEHPELRTPTANARINDKLKKEEDNMAPIQQMISKKNNVVTVSVVIAIVAVVVAVAAFVYMGSAG